MAEQLNHGKSSGSSSEFELLTRPPTSADPLSPKRSSGLSRTDLSAARVVVSPTAIPSKTVPGNQSGLALALLRALKRRWALASILSLVVATIVAIAVWTQLPPPKPTATAKVQIPAVPQTVIGQHPDAPLERGTQIALVRSRLVLNTALRPAEINELPVIRQIKQTGGEPLDWLAKNLQVDFPEGPEILRISLSYEDGEQAKALVNAVYEAYLSEIHGKSKRLRNERLLNLTKQAERADTTLRTLRDQAQAMTNDNGALDDKQFKLQQELAANQVSILKSQILSVRGDLLRLKAEESAIRDRTPSAAKMPPEVIEGYIAKDPEIIESIAKRESIETQLRNIRSVAVDPDKLESTKKLNAQLEAIKKNYEQLRINIRGQIEDRLMSRSKEELEARAKSLKDEIESSKEMEKLLVDEANRLESFIKVGNKKNFDLEPLRIRIRLAENLYERINGMITTLTLEQDAPPRVIELEKAYIVPVEETKRKLTMSGAGALGAIGVVCMFVGLLELRNRRIESSESVSTQLGLPIIGTIPRQLRFIAKRYGNTSNTGWESMLNESMNATRTMLMHGHGLSNARVIQIVSPISGEGKTTLAVHLAASIAMTGLRTVLVDGDLRNPNTNKRFQIPDGAPGVCDLLRGERQLDDVICPTVVEGLDLIPAGHWGEDTHQHLATSGPRDLIETLRSRYDFVILDSSPILPVSDPLLLARHVDGVLISLIQDISRLPQVEEIHRRLTSLRIPVLGVVLHGTNVHSHGYGSNYYYKRPTTKPIIEVKNA